MLGDAEGVNQNGPTAEFAQNELHHLHQLKVCRLIRDSCTHDREKRERKQGKVNAHILHDNDEFITLQHAST